MEVRGVVREGVPAAKAEEARGTGQLEEGAEAADLLGA